MPNPNPNQNPDQNNNQQLDDIFASVDPLQQQPSQQNPSPQSNPAPIQPPAVPPQQEAGNQNATGLESQPVLSENYVPQPSYQKAQIGPQKSPFGKILIILAGILLIAAAVIFFLFFFNKGTLYLTLTPPEALVSIDGKNYQTEKQYKIKLSSGEHVLEVKADSYVTYQNKINIRSFKRNDLKIDLKTKPTAEKLIDGKMQFISISPDQKYILGLWDNGKAFYRVSIAGEENQNQENNSGNANQNLTSVRTNQAITEKKFANIISVNWNPGKALAILKIKNEKSKLINTEFYRSDLKDGTITTWLYDFNRYDLKGQESFYLGNFLGDTIWTADGGKIIYFSEKDKTLYKTSPKGESREVLKNIPDFSDPFISISPDGKYLTLIPRSKLYQKNSLYAFELYSKTLSEVIKDGNQKGAIFNPSSDKIIYATFADDPNSNIYTILSWTSLDGKNSQNLDARALIENISFLDNTNIVYPGSDDKTGSEKLYKMNIETKEEVEFQYQTADKLHFRNPVIFNNKLFFLSENNLYSLELITSQY